MTEDERGYQRIMQNLITTPLHPLFRPVHFTIDQKACAGVGTLILNQSGQHTSIITAAHLFTYGKRWSKLFYRVLQPHSPEFFSVNSVKQVQEEDVAMCYPGPIAPIVGFSRHTGGIPVDRVGTPYKAEYPDCMLLTTGEKIPVIGNVRFDDPQECYFVLRYENCHGESGSGFLRSPNELYVLMGQLALNASLRKIFDIPKTESQLTLATGIGVNF